MTSDKSDDEGSVCSQTERLPYTASQGESSYSAPSLRETTSQGEETSPTPSLRETANQEVIDSSPNGEEDTLCLRTGRVNDETSYDFMNTSHQRLCQLDGNLSSESINYNSDSSLDISVNSNFLPYCSNASNETTTENEEVQHPISVIVSNRNHESWKEDRNIPRGWKSKNNNITVKKDNRCLLASKLPSLFVTNHRSFFPKFNNFVELVKTLDLTLGLHSEIWEVKEKKDHQDKIEEALELEGLQYVSNPRPSRRGGGAAITLMGGDFTLSRLDVVTPQNLEVVWGLVRPNQPTKDFKGILVCSFYSVPHSKRKSQLVEHIAINYSQLKTKYKDCFFLTGGDKNDLDIRRILDISPSFHSHNSRPTYGQKNIDVMISDMVHLFNEPVIIQNVPTDIPDGQPGGGKRSDHPVVYTKPRLDRITQPAREVVVKKSRRIKDDDIRKFGKWIQQETWEEMLNCNHKANKFSEIVFAKLDEICPEVEIKLTKMDGKVTSMALQSLARRRLREFTKHGNSAKFKEIKKKQQARIKLENLKEIEKKIENANEKGMKWMRDADRMSARPGDDTTSTFTLPAHLDANFTPLQSAEAIASYFSSISQEYTPIEEDTSAPWLEAQKILNGACCDHPTILEYQVYEGSQEN